MDFWATPVIAGDLAIERPRHHSKIIEYDNQASGAKTPRLPKAVLRHYLHLFRPRLLLYIGYRAGFVREAHVSKRVSSDDLNLLSDLKRVADHPPASTGVTSESGRILTFFIRCCSGIHRSSGR